MKKREPDFNQILKVLKKQKPDRPVLFEIFLNYTLHVKFGGPAPKDPGDARKVILHQSKAWEALGYDYTTIWMHYNKSIFPIKSATHHAASISQNEVVTIADRKDFEAYPWSDMDKYDYSFLDGIEKELPAGMKLIAMGPGGVLENITNLLGFDNLCLLTYDDPQLLQDVFDKVGSTLVRYYEIACGYPAVGACTVNDDWGHKTQTMLSAADMRKYVVPWHKRIVEVIHKSGRPAIMHSCGNLREVMEDIITDIKVDAKHSYEDLITPVEQMYDKYVGRLGIMGGMDVDFICRSEIPDIKKRCNAMLERASAKGGYALGTGNSVPEYMPMEKYFAMVECATGQKPAG